LAQNCEIDLQQWSPAQLKPTNQCLWHMVAAKNAAHASIQSLDSSWTTAAMFLSENQLNHEA
jgi:hypothetical protein